MEFVRLYNNTLSSVVWDKSKYTKSQLLERSLGTSHVVFRSISTSIGNLYLVASSLERMRDHCLVTRISNTGNFEPLYKREFDTNVISEVQGCLFSIGVA